MAKTEKGELIFKPYFVQKRHGTNLLDWAYASDVNWDAFHSNIHVDNGGVKISDTEGHDKFGINVKWNVEGFGYLYITADNGGEFYELPPAGTTKELNLNYELAHSRISRNKSRYDKFAAEGWMPRPDTKKFRELAEEYLEDAAKARSDNEKCAQLSEKALLYAMRNSEQIELDRAWDRIAKAAYRDDFFVGCDARGYMQMEVDLFFERFTELFDYATITYYLKSGVFDDFEPKEGDLQFDLRDVLLKQLRKRNITVEGRPLFWFYKTTTPDWLRNMSYDKLLKYIESHARTVVGHYGDQMYAWEIVNEMHDWANELQLKPEQLVEVAKLACEVTKATNPKVLRLINNCCPFAEYVQLGKWTDIPAKYPQRTPYQFMKDLVDAGVEFDISGIQMYFPYRDLSDTIILIERFEALGKPINITETGTSSGPSTLSVETGKLEISQEAYAWHRQWDQDLQADWIEGLYTLVYSKPSIKSISWYDFVDPFDWIANGGLLSSAQGERKEAFDRLKSLRERWKAHSSSPGKGTR